MERCVAVTLVAQWAKRPRSARCPGGSIPMPTVFCSNLKNKGKDAPNREDVPHRPIQP